MCGCRRERIIETHYCLIYSYNILIIFLCSFSSIKFIPDQATSMVKYFKGNISTKLGFRPSPLLKINKSPTANAYLHVCLCEWIRESVYGCVCVRLCVCVRERHGVTESTLFLELPCEIHCVCIWKREPI